MEETKFGLVVAKDNKNISVDNYNLRLDLLDGWENLGERQQKYLMAYAQNPHAPTLTAMQIGYPKGEIDRWFSQSDFKQVADQIFDVYTEVMKAKDYEDAWDNPKVRARVIQSQENKGKYNKETGSKHNHLHVNTDNSLKEVLKLMDKGEEKEE